MPEYLPAYKPGDAITITAGADAVDWLGVASRDAAAGQAVGVYCENVQRVQAASALPQGTRVKCAAAGQVTTWVSGTDAPDRMVGILLEAATGAGVPTKCKFVR